VILAGLLGCVGTLLLTGAAALVLHGRRWATPVIYGVSLIATTMGLILAGRALFSPSLLEETLSLPLGLPWLGAHFRVDALAAFFLLVINLGGATASLFAIGHGAHEETPGRVLPFFPTFIAGMNLVLMAADAFTFLFSWEFMSLSSWALVMAHHRRPGNATAGYLYLLMASFGTLALLLAFGLLAGPSGGYEFAVVRQTPPGAAVSAVVLVLALIGAGSKAGLFPLHAWLPLAHPAAPTHVSALMSGVMTKVAVYGFIRIVFDLLGTPTWWWGAVVSLLGGVTAVMGVLYALLQSDLKRLLAYSTVENLGIVFIGLGLSLAFEANEMQGAAALALTAALFHGFNHSLFKSLLFYGAGAVLGSTGERDMERLGGLIHRMPRTALAFLIGAAAISALPPLNGFVSEWLMFQAILLSPNLPQWLLKFLVPTVGALLALSAALAAACFVKAFGITFLGRPRSDVARDAAETDRWSIAAMFVLVALCLLAGILPGYFIDALAPVIDALTGGSLPRQERLDWLTIVPIAQSRSSYNGLLLFFFIALAASLAAEAIHRFASAAVRRSAPWDCGFPDPRPATQYTAGSLSQPIRRVFGTVLFRAREEVRLPPPGDGRPASLRVRLHDVAWEVLYAPIARVVGFVAERLNALQFLTIRGYLTLVFGALVTLLTVLAVWQ